MTRHPLIVVADLADHGAIRPATLAAVDYVYRRATTPVLPAAVDAATRDLDEDAATAPAADLPAIAELTDDMRHWAKAA